jgi:hypothetical protein
MSDNQTPQQAGSSSSSNGSYYYLNMPAHSSQAQLQRASSLTAMEDNSVEVFISKLDF